MTRKKTSDPKPSERKHSQHEKGDRAVDATQLNDDSPTNPQRGVGPAHADLLKNPPYDSQSERPTRSDDPGSLDEETLSAKAPYNKTYGVQGSKAD